MQAGLPVSHEAPKGPLPRQEVRAFWTGPQLSPYEELSLRSLVAGGARTLLYSTNMELRVPDGVELIDAREILSGQVHRFTFADGARSPALHSDLFRYLAIRQFGGWYVDLDIILLGKELPRQKAYLARESENLVNGAVMTFPQGSPFITAAIEEAWKLLPEAGPGAPLSKRISIGPELVTRLVREYALDHVVRPRSSAYEIGYDEIPAMFDPAHHAELEERTADSDFVHLWNEIWGRVRLPKHYGPPEGSFLDGLFRRFGMGFADEARLSIETITVWFRERNLLEQLRWRLRTELLPANAIEQVIEQEQGERPRLVHSLSRDRYARSVRAERAPAAPQTLRTFWHGETIGIYPLLCLRSFVDRGHRIELFSFETKLDLPDWITLKDAAEIVPRERVLRYLPEQRRFAVHAALFRLALLHRLGGWWIDPDVVLLRAVLPATDHWFSRAFASNMVSTAALKLPAAHPALTEALVRAPSFEEQIEDWGKAGALLLTSLLAANRLMGSRQSDHETSALSWSGVSRLFDPSQADLLAKELDGRHFLDLHQEAWLRAGVPGFLGPPRGSFLDRLFQRHEFGLTFAAEMEFDDVKRWLAHMYDSIRLREASDA
jgi:hypothetical protein